MRATPTSGRCRSVGDISVRDSPGNIFGLSHSAESAPPAWNCLTSQLASSFLATLRSLHLRLARRLRPRMRVASMRPLNLKRHDRRRIRCSRDVRDGAALVGGRSACHPLAPSGRTRDESIGQASRLHEINGAASGARLHRRQQRALRVNPISACESGQTVRTPSEVGRETRPQPRGDPREIR